MTANTKDESLPKAMLTVDEWCHRYGPSRSTLYNLIKDGELRIVKLGRRTYIPESSTEAWLAGLEHQMNRELDEIAELRSEA